MLAASMLFATRQQPESLGGGTFLPFCDLLWKYSDSIRI